MSPPFARSFSPNSVFRSIQHGAQSRASRAFPAAPAYTPRCTIIHAVVGAADVNGTKFGSRVGAFNSKEAWVQHGGKLGAVDVAAYLH